MNWKGKKVRTIRIIVQKAGSYTWEWSKIKGDNRTGASFLQVCREPFKGYWYTDQTKGYWYQDDLTKRPFLGSREVRDKTYSHQPIVGFSLWINMLKNWLGR